jgi:phosphoglycolate phosphatase
MTTTVMSRERMAIKTSQLPKPRAVLFDWDGTMVDSIDAIYQSFNLIQAELGKPALTMDEARRIMALGTSKEIFAHLNPEHFERSIELFYQYVPGLRLQNLKAVQPELVTMLDLLKANGIQIGVVSNARQYVVAPEVVHMGWTHYFDVVIGAVPDRPGKPDPAPVYAAFDALNIPHDASGDVWFVGDMETDEKAAQSAGCKFLYYTGHVENAAERDRLQADLKFDRYADLVDVLKAVLV